MDAAKPSPATPAAQVSPESLPTPPAPAEPSVTRTVIGSPAPSDTPGDAISAACAQVADWLPITTERCDSVINGVLGNALYGTLILALALLLIVLGIKRAQRRTQSKVTSSARDTADATRAGPLTRLADALLARRRERRYLRALAETPSLTMQPMLWDNPVPLRQIQVPLKLADDHRPQEHDAPPPLTASGMPAVTGRALTLAQALAGRPRLLLLGEPGAGKSTLLRGLALAVAERDPKLAEAARANVPNRLARLLDRLRRGIDGLGVFLPSMILGLAALLAWVIGVFVAGAPLTHLLAALVWLVAGFALLRRGSMLIRGRSIEPLPLGLGLAALLLGYVWLGPAWLGSAPVWPVAAWATMAAVALLLYAELKALPVKLLKRLALGATRYPLPVLLTLNDLAADRNPLEVRAAANVAKGAEIEAGAARRLLARALKAGRCLVLLDALDEVSDPNRRDWLRGELRRLLDGWRGRNQLVLTSRRVADAEKLVRWQKLVVQRFEQRQIEEYLARRFGDDLAGEAQAAGLHAELARNPRLLALAGNPLLLTMIANLYKADGRLPPTRARLFERAVKLVTEDWDAHTDAACRERERAPLPCSGEALRCVLRALAADLHGRGWREVELAHLMKLLRAAAAACGLEVTADALLAALLDQGLLRQLSGSHYDFAHLTLQEYLTAAWFHAESDSAALLARLAAPEDAGWWREVVRLYAGLGGEAATLVRGFLTAEPLLAAACLADASAADGADLEEVAALVITELTRRLDAPPAAAQAAADALAEIRHFGALAPLEQALAEPESAPARAVAAVLALAPGNEAGLPARVQGGLGGLLRLLHGVLPTADEARRERLLTLLENLGQPLCHVPAGAFRMGTDVGGFPDERPAHEVRLAEYWMDRDPVTNAQFAVFARETGFADTKWRDIADFEKKSDHPVVFVAWEHARAYADWCGKRLPTEAEWEKAARGTDARRYPWRGPWDAERCNTRRQGTSPIGAYAGLGDSPYGCRDMAGNVAEWCEDWYDANWYRAKERSAQDPTGPTQGTSPVVRGGSWNNSPAIARAALRFRSLPHFQLDCLGFRLVCVGPIR
jgi:formylglycine-generating enzyme